MIDSPDADDVRRADLARDKLIKDIRQIKKMGDNMIQKTESAIHKAPVLLGLGAVGAALVGVAVYASRSGTHHPRIARERSFSTPLTRTAIATVPTTKPSAMKAAVPSTRSKPPGRNWVNGRPCSHRGRPTR